MIWTYDCTIQSFRRAGNLELRVEPVRQPVFVTAIWLPSSASRDCDRMRLTYPAFRVDCVSDVGTLYDFPTGKHGFSNCTITLSGKPVIGYGVSRNIVYFGTAFAA